MDLKEKPAALVKFNLYEYAQNYSKHNQIRNNSKLHSLKMYLEIKY